MPAHPDAATAVLIMIFDVNKVLQDNDRGKVVIIAEEFSR